MLTAALLPAEATVSHHRFVLPRSDGSWLTDPVSEQWPPVLAANHNALSRADFDCQGRSFGDLRRLTQQHAAIAAARYTSELLSQNIAVPKPASLIVTGHQPELFHPGVWAKNFAVHRLAKQTQANGLNLIIDNDTHHGTGIAVPTGTRAALQTTTIPFDEPRPVCPWEELPLSDREVFDGFARQVSAQLHPWGIEPVLNEAWPAARHFADRTERPRLCDCLSAMRVATERRFGAGNLELPMSRLSEVPGFHWFAAHILAQLPQFQVLHNEIVRDYRRRHQLRSRTHPVPELATQDDWREAPFWVWRAGESQRDRLFARQVADEIQLRDRRDVFLKLPLTPDRSACCAVEQLAALPSKGIRLRSRALTTTLFARLFLADLFVHGIGGAKYDEMTDELITRFYRLPAVPYATISGTLHLPLGGTWTAGSQALGQNLHTLWELDHQPERFLPASATDVQSMIADKRRLIGEQHTAEAATVRRRSMADREQNRQRYRRLREINHELQPAVQAVRQQILDQRQELLSHQSANRILASREFAWVLFPEERLRQFLANVPVAEARRV